MGFKGKSDLGGIEISPNKAKATGIVALLFFVLVIGGWLATHPAESAAIGVWVLAFLTRLTQLAVVLALIALIGVLVFKSRRARRW